MLQRIVIIALKIGIFCLLLYILYWQLFYNRQLSLYELGQLLEIQWQISNPSWLIITVLLLPLNWSLEVWKWLPLMRPVETISFGRATQAVLAGLTISLFTPNRVGEYGGRILLISKENRAYAVFTTLVGSLAQWIVLLLGGWISFALFCWLYPAPMPVVTWIQLTVMVVGILLMTILVWIYFNFNKTLLFLSKFRWLARWVNPVYATVQKHHTPRELVWVLGLAMGRYLTYSVQYFCLMQFFGCSLGIFEVAMAIALIYFLQTGIPLPPSTGLIARGNIALFVFGLLQSGYVSLTMQVAILASTFGLWLLNILFPALLGVLVIGKVMWKI